MPGREIMDLLAGYSKSLEKIVTEEIRKLLRSTKGPHKVQSVMEGTEPIEKDRVVVLVRLDLVTKMLLKSSKKEPSAGLQSTTDQP